MKDEIKEILDNPKILMLSYGNYIPLDDYVKLKDCITNLQEENERLKNGYCELKVKCNNGECDCTNEEYDEMVEGNIKLSLEVDRLNNIIDELERFLKYEIYCDFNKEMTKGYQDTLDKLKELKEGK